MNNKNTVFRLLDANMNRAVEGIRVLEETARMFLDDSDLTIKFKETRHTLTGIIKKQRNLDFKLLSERGSERDVFRSEELRTERKRSDLLSVVRANSSRAREALRSLEEYVKLVFPSLSIEFKKIRFGLYNLEKELVFKVHKRYLFNDGDLKLGVILDRDSIGIDISKAAEGVIANGVDILVYSSDKLSDKAFMEESLILESICEGKSMFMIKRRLDAAIFSGADGICIGAGDAELWMCRKVAGEGFYIAGIYELHELNALENTDFPDMIILKTDNTIPGVDHAYKSLKAANIPFLYYCNRKPDKIDGIILNGASGLILEPKFSDSEETFKQIGHIREEFGKV